MPTLIQVLNGIRPANSAPVVVTETPNKCFSYSGDGYTIIQHMMIDQSGEAFPELMEDSVLGPVGMKSRTFEQPLNGALRRMVAMQADRQASPSLIAISL